MTSLTTIPHYRSIIDVNRTVFLSSFESYYPYRRVEIKRKARVDPAPGRFKNDPNVVGGMSSRKATMNPALGDHGHLPQQGMMAALQGMGMTMSQKGTQQVAGGTSAYQRLEQVLKTDRSWR